MRGDLAVVEMMSDALDLLVRLVALAGHEHHRAGLRHADRGADRLAPVGDAERAAQNMLKK